METASITTLSLDYNTDRPQMALGEYGRLVQTMVEFCLTIEDKAKRTEAAAHIVETVGRLNPSLRGQPDFARKVWDHLHVISGFQLEVDGPFPAPLKELLEAKPERVPYPPKSRSHRYYGVILQNLINTVAEMEPSEERQGIEYDIANQMKRAYLSWNKDTVDDAVIFNDLRILSGGRLGQEGSALTVAKGVVSQNAPLHTKNRKKKKPNSSNFTNKRKGGFFRK
ncbi:MAG: hypothetical protein RL429_1354 [Bacteroidota bacterium]|jgi:hypothetical protein